MKITMVKKILADGSPCQKCGEVEHKMRQAGQLDRIDEILIADERDLASPGMLLAGELGVDRAPFFLVEEPGKPPLVYTVYLRFVKEILDQKTDDRDELREILDGNPDLDFI
jgi:hypothetical protein